MIVLSKTAAFLLGIFLCVQLIAALYGFIDLSYALKRTLVFVLRRLSIWGLATVVVWRLLPEWLRPAFGWGLVGYVFLYGIVFGIYQLVFANNAKSIQSK